MMSHVIDVANREVKLGFRNPWSYSFLILFCVFSLSLLVINSLNVVEGYSGTTSSLVNLILYLLPLMTLFIGSFSLTSEKEDGSWQLLSTYPLATSSFILGKYLGLSCVLLTIVSFGYGLMGLISGFVGNSFSLLTYGLFILFSCGLVFMFLTIALFIGSVCKNRWQALTISVSVWFFSVIAWPTLLIAGLSFVPYTWVQPMLSIFTLLNPAELIRLFVVIKLGGGSVLGPEYYRWVQWIQQPVGTWIIMAIIIVWITVFLLMIHWIWERRRYRG
ncbi:Uncharacterized protein PIL02S_01854 [Paenibacillus illinoisensis]|uniref:ABC transporter permease n=2 Tax=Paenibacillus illinoisensis TaxID=59845 RepID=A0A2W0CCD2_9BACL|nr:Uncharacterized protein PIL02S_01854 [Paenibacillus illinoisensis]